MKKKRKKEKSQRDEIPEEIYFSFQPLFSSRWRRLRAKKWNTVGKDQAEETRGKCLLIRRETFVSAEKSSRLFVPPLFRAYVSRAYISFIQEKREKKNESKDVAVPFFSHSFQMIHRN